MWQRRLFYLTLDPDSNIPFENLNILF